MEKKEEITINRSSMKELQHQNVSDDDTDCECTRCEKEKNDKSIEQKKFKQMEERKWSDEDTRLLIKLWSNKSILYDSKHPYHYHKDERNKTVNELQEELQEAGLDYSVKQINEKMINLRTYFGHQLRMIENNKGRSVDNQFICKWRYYNDMAFLNGHLLSRCSHSNNINRSNRANKNNAKIRYFSSSDSEVEDGVCQSRSVNKNKKLKTANLDIPTNNSFESIDKDFFPSPGVNETNIEEQTEDEIFGTLLTKMISNIPDCQQKAMLKLELQHKIVTFQYNIQPGNKKDRYNNNNI